MKKVNHFLITALLLISVTGCGSQDSPGKGSQPEILNEYFEAFNNHDVDALSAMVTDDIRLMSLTPDTMTVDLTGREELEIWLTGYFNSLPNVSSTYSDLSVREPFYSFVETAHWGPDSAGKQQSSLATYLIKDDKIHRVWYYYPE